MKKVFKISIDNTKSRNVYGGGMALVAAESAHIALYIYNSIGINRPEENFDEVAFKATEVDGLLYNGDNDIICDNIYIE